MKIKKKNQYIYIKKNELKDKKAQSGKGFSCPARASP
jgi:hypothetical protein